MILITFLFLVFVSTVYEMILRYRRKRASAENNSSKDALLQNDVSHTKALNPGLEANACNSVVELEPMQTHVELHDEAEEDALSSPAKEDAQMRTEVEAQPIGPENQAKTQDNTMRESNEEVKGGMLEPLADEDAAKPLERENEQQTQKQGK